MNNNEGEWITVTSKKRKNKNVNNFTFDKTKVKLWYDTSTWQHKVLTNSYKYKDGTTVLEKFNLTDMHDNYAKTQSNYDKNYFCKKLMRVISEYKWQQEESLVHEDEPVTLEEPVVLEVKEEETLQQKQEESVIEVKPVQETVVDNLESAKCKEGISWASVV